jgi:hypothetical protein
LTHRARIAAFSAVLLLSILFAGFASTPSPLTLDDVVSLLNAKVGASIILRQASSSGISFTMGVREILAMKSAGADDALIEALISRSSRKGDAASSESADASSFRIYKETSEDGEEVLHITNLDEQGRRIGGEVESRADYPNRYDASAPSAAKAEREQEYSVIGERQPPVVVNVYPPGGEGYDGVEAAYVSPYQYSDPYAYLYPRGRLPGMYYGSYGRGCGLRGGTPLPGSYTHFMMYHTHYGGPPSSPAPIAAPHFGPRFVAIGPASAQAALPAIRAPYRVRR